MKSPIQRIALLCAIATTTIVSCNSGNADKTKTDTTAAVATAPAPLKQELFIKHKVADYAKWKPVFDADAANRKAAGLQDHVVARGLEDSNTVLVITYMDDVAKAKAMVADPKLKETMQKAGVTGAPEIDLIHRADFDTTATAQSARAMVKIKVKDWDAWKKAFDADKSVRLANGVQDRMVGYNVDDNHLVTIVSVINDMAKAKAMMSSKELGEKMKSSGVEGKPSFFFYHVVEMK